MSLMKKILVGDTLEVFWINSGTNPSEISASIYNGSESLVNSVAMTDSGNGHYFSYYTPNTTGYLVAETKATVNSYPFRNRIRFKVITGNADG
jgi:hypothetical protein